jgi:hypothetical protein
MNMTIRTGLAALVALLLGSVAAAQETPSPFDADSCLSSPGEARTWAAYCSEAQALHDGLMQRSRTAPVELKQLKSLLLDKGDRHMWQFLSIGLLERSPYFSSKPRKFAMIEEIEATLDPAAKPDRFVALAADSIRVFEEQESGAVAGLVARGNALMVGESNKHLMAMLGSTMIKLARLSTGAGAYDVARDALDLCEAASDAWGNPLMPQRCYNLISLSGNEPADFLKHIATREEALTCGRNLKPLCNLFRKTGHGRFLGEAQG